jgi:hypothetical protein
MERAYPDQTIKAATTVNMRGRIIFNGLYRVPFPPKIHSINRTESSAFLKTYSQTGRLGGLSFYG